MNDADREEYTGEEMNSQWWSGFIIGLMVALFAFGVGILCMTA